MQVMHQNSGSTYSTCSLSLVKLLGYICPVYASCALQQLCGDSHYQLLLLLLSPLLLRLLRGSNGGGSSSSRRQSPLIVPLIHRYRHCLVTRSCAQVGRLGQAGRRKGGRINGGRAQSNTHLVVKRVTGLVIFTRTREFTMSATGMASVTLPHCGCCTSVIISWSPADLIHQDPLHPVQRIGEFQTLKTLY